MTAAALYLVNVAVGLTAQLTRIRFGKAHHVLYGLVFAAAAAAAVFEYHPALLLTLAALAAFPKARPRTIWHPGLAAVGAVGYVLAFLL